MNKVILKIILMQTCFQTYFHPIGLYIKKSFYMAFENESALFYSALMITTTMQVLKEFFDVNFFGVTNYLLLLVVGTVLIDAYYGVRKSLRQANEASKKANSMKGNTPEKRMLLKVAEMKRFSTNKLQFTFFKCITLIAYLYFVKNILEVDDEASVYAEVLGFTTAVVIKIPLAIFWYQDFKSIGNNMEFLFGKKLPIFPIVESIFELKFRQYFSKENQGINNNNQDDESGQINS